MSEMHINQFINDKINSVSRCLFTESLPLKISKHHGPSILLMPRLSLWWAFLSQLRHFH